MTQYQRVAIFDVDGTLMDIDHRRKYVEGDKKDWKSFLSPSTKCLLWSMSIRVPSTTKI